MSAPFIREVAVGAEIASGSPYLDRPVRTRAQAIADIKAAGAAEERVRIAGLLADRAAAIEAQPITAARERGHDFRRMAVLLKRGLI